MQIFKSLKWKFFTSLILLTFAVIIANRLIAQLIVSNTITNSVLQQIEVSLAECGSSVLGGDDFQRCLDKANSGNLLKVTTDFFTYCDLRSTEQPNEKCALFDKNSVKWKSTKTTSKSFESANINFGNDIWYAIRPLNDSAARKIIYKESASNEIKTQIWTIRDRTNLFTFPLIILSQLLIGFYLFKIIKRPIQQIESSLIGINENTLTTQQSHKNSYVEFIKIEENIDSMRRSLSESFNKAKRFSGDVAHELKTPLTILRGNAHELAKNASLDSVQEYRILTISDEIERLITITDKLLLLSRADSKSLLPSLKNISLSDLINYWINEATSSNTHLKITNNIQPEVYWDCDVVLIRMLISNLYENAVKYNINNGWIDFKLTQKDGVILFSTENPSLQINDKLEALAFERFYRSSHLDSNSQEGTGLGLSICFEIAKIHNAALDLKVTERGTVVITLTIHLS